MLSLSHNLLSLIEAAGPQLAQVDESVTHAPVRAGGWSHRQLLGHLIDSASNNHQRFVRASLQPSLNFPGYDQNGNVRTQHFQSASWQMLTSLWHSYNQLLAHVIAHLPESKLDTACKIGAENPVTLKSLATDYVDHLSQHLEKMGITAKS